METLAHNAQWLLAIVSALSAASFIVCLTIKTCAWLITTTLVKTIEHEARYKTIER